MQAPIASCSRRTSAASSLAVLAKGDSFARWQISLASSRPSPASWCWSRRNPWSRTAVGRQERVQGGDVDRVGVRTEALQRGLLLEVALDHPHAGLALAARLGQQEGRGRRRSASEPGRCGAWPTASRRA